VQSVTGHKSDRMTEWYSHPDARQLDTVIEAQAVIAGINQPKSGKSGEDTIPMVQGNFNGLKIVNMRLTV